MTIDLLHILKKRRISVERWCKDVGITNITQANNYLTDLIAKGEYFISDEFKMAVFACVKPLKPDTLPPPAPPKQNSLKLTRVVNKKPKRLVLNPNKI